MFQLDYKDRRPIYEQIKEKMKFLIIEGAIREGERIPSVRELAVSMAINPNTIQKAYKELESEGYIYSLAAKGYFVTPRGSAEKNENAELMTKFSDIVRELLYLGTEKSELSDIIDNIYKGGNRNGNDNGD